MIKSELVKQLKQDASENRFRLDGEYIVFDKQSNCNYQILPSFTLADLKTANPIGETRLNVGLLAVLDDISSQYGKKIEIRASYRSNEYNILNFGMSDSDLYTKGDAVSISVPESEVSTLHEAVKAHFKPGELGYYKWGFHLGWTKEAREWEKYFDDSIVQKLKDLFINNDKMKNILLLAAAGVAGWWFFLRKS